MTGSSLLFDLTETTRSVLVNNAYGSRFNTLGTAETTDDGSLDSQWRAWIEQEKTRRLSWSVFENDSTATFLFNARPYIRLGRMRINMSCSDDLWEAESAEVWAALRCQPTQYLQGPFYPDLLDEIVGSEEIGPSTRITNFRHQRVMMLTLARMEWTLKDMRSYTPKHLIMRGFPTFQEEQRQAEIALSFFEDTIRMNLRDPLNTTGLLQAARNLPLSHMSHLHSAGDLMDWLYLFLQTDERELRGAQIRRARWALEDAHRVRQVAFHCGQILGLSRRFPNAFPQQPFMIFHAAAALWCVAPFLRSPQSNEPDRIERVLLQGAVDTSNYVLLDYLPDFEPHAVSLGASKDGSIFHKQIGTEEWLELPEEESDQSRHPTVKIQGVEDVSSRAGRLMVLSTAGELMRNAVSGISDKFQAIFDLVKSHPENWK